MISPSSADSSVRPSSGGPADPARVPPGLSLRPAWITAFVALLLWGAATAGAPWLAPRISRLADVVEGALGVELVPQEVR